MAASNFSWKPFCWLKALLLIALLQPIVCTNGDSSPARRNRSAHTHPNQNLTENLNSVLDNRTFEYRARKPQEQQQRLQQSAEPKDVRESERGDKFDAVIRDIFSIGPGDGITLFNSTSNPQLMHINPMQADDPLPQEPPFKVQRSPDGKLNVVFNDLLHLQKTAKPQLQYNPGSDQWPPHDSNRPRCVSGVRDGKTFCTEVHNYPQLGQLDLLLKREFSLFFGEDQTPPLNITVRTNEPIEETFCVATERIIYPKAGETKDANWLFILNDNQNFRQGVRVEECRNQGSQCKFIEHLPNGYVATCKQNYIYRTMIAITHNGTLTQDNFKLPSCCKCVLRQVL